MKTKRKNIKQLLLSDLFVKIGRKLGIKVALEKEWGIVGQIAYPNGRKRYFRGTTVDINTMGASEIARDKDYAKIFMQKMGYPVIPWKKFYSKEWARIIKSDQTIDKAWPKVKELGLPVFVKPNSKSQGVGVVYVQNKSEFEKAFRIASHLDNVILVEKAVVGKDYRVVILDNQVISAYERIPLSVVGDGRNTITELINRRQDEFLRAGREKTFLLNDQRIVMTFKREKISLATVLPKGKLVKLLHNANLSTGGTSVDVTDYVHPFYKREAIRLTKDMGLRLCGVDLMIVGDIMTPAKEWYVLEINSAPGLDHYASMGRKQERIVEALYTKVIIAMGKK